MAKIFLIDSNCLNRLASRGVRDRLRASLRATGKEFWPTAMNILEALKSRDAEKRVRFLETIHDLAQDNHALTLPTEGLRRTAQAIALREKNIEWTDSRLTRLFRDPSSVTEEEIVSVRDYLTEAEDSFTAMHVRASETLRPRFKEEGGMVRWPTVRAFLDEVWNSPEHLHSYIEKLWAVWELPGAVRYEELLKHDAWRLFFDGWGATVYERQIVHPQRRKVQHSDLIQMVYMGPASGRILATGDHAFRDLGNEILHRSYALARIVTLDEVLG